MRVNGAALSNARRTEASKQIISRTPFMTETTMLSDEKTQGSRIASCWNHMVNCYDILDFASNRQISQSNDL